VKSMQPQKIKSLPAMAHDGHRLHPLFNANPPHDRGPAAIGRSELTSLKPTGIQLESSRGHLTK